MCCAKRVAFSVVSCPQRLQRKSFAFSPDLRCVATSETTSNFTFTAFTTAPPRPLKQTRQWFANKKSKMKQILTEIKWDK
jgi:hypothetical protein